ncbi:MAG: single-stranded DNA-binding protein [Treponema sp.]
MHNLNSLIIEGNVVRDPIVKATPRGTPLCLFSIASNRFFRQDDKTAQETSFFDVETWSRLAELCGENCTKGRGVRVVGRLKQDRWTGSDGKQYSKIKVVAEHVEFKPRFKNGKPPADAFSDMAELQKSEAETEDVPAF